MARQSRDVLTNFLRAVHRRMIVLRAVEGAGVGVVSSCGFSLILASSLLWLGRDAMQLCVVALVGGAVIGASWSMLRRPRVVEAAVEADRQLGLADLLATAWMRRADDDPWQRAVIAMAEQRCRALSPSAVVLNRFGTRAWSGIGLSAALVMTIAALSSSPRQTTAITPGGFSAATQQANEPRRWPQALAPARDSASAPQAHQQRSAVEADEAMNAAERGAARDGTPLRARQGAGTASAHTNVRPAPASPRPTSAAGSPDGLGSTTGGGGRSSAPQRPQDSSQAASGASSDARPSSDAPSQATATPQLDSAPDAPSRTGQVRDQYRDVLREYFEQP